MRAVLQQYYGALRLHHGPSGWWPGDTPFEIAVGAILTQNTAWTNVEKAIANLKSAGLLDCSAILGARDSQLEKAVRPSGYFRVKTRRLRDFCTFLSERFDGDFANMETESTKALRSDLLAVNGIGPETADAILLYAVGRPVFVVDTYTRRILSRHGLVPADIDYESLRAVFESSLPAVVETWREYHAYFVLTGKDFCRTKAYCEGCPLRSFLLDTGPL